MKKRLDKTKMLNELVDYFARGNKAEFARMIGVSTAAFNRWFVRGTYKPFVVLEKLPVVSAEWLMRGEGPMLRKDINKISDASEGNKAIAKRPEVPEVDVEFMMQRVGFYEDLITKKQLECDRLTEIIHNLTTKE